MTEKLLDNQTQQRSLERYMPRLRPLLVSTLIVLALMQPASTLHAASTITYHLELRALDVALWGEEGDSCALVNYDHEVSYLFVDGPDIGDEGDSPTLNHGIVLRDPNRDGQKVCRFVLEGDLQRYSSYSVRILGPGSGFLLEETYTAEELSSGSLLVELDTRSEIVSPYRDQSVPLLPSAVFAHDMMTHSETSDPTAQMNFLTLGFPTEEDAASNILYLAEWAISNETDGLVVESSGFEEISVGPLGDERVAFQKAHSEGWTYVTVVVRSGATVLIVDAWAASDDELAVFVADYVESFIAQSTSDPASLVPSLNTLPVGWSIQYETNSDRLLEQIRQQEPATPSS